MRRVVTAVFVLLLLLAFAPWGIGRIAETRVNDGLDRFIEQAPYLGIAERKWTSGWFRSEQDVTFEVLGPWMRAMNPAVMPGASANAGTAPAPVQPLRFTVRNEILHGPVLWPLGVGIARVNSRFVLSDQVRKELVAMFGTDEPVRVSTRVGFFGGGTTTFSSDTRAARVKGAPGATSWDAFKVDVSYSRDLSEFDLDGEWPRIEVNNAGDGSSLLLNATKLTSTSTRLRGDLYDTDFKLAIDQVHLVGPDKQPTEIADLHYLVNTSMDDDFMDVAFKVGSGSVKSKELTGIGLDLKAVNYDFTIRRLHADTLEKLMSALKDSYRAPASGVANVDAARMTAVKEQGLELLRHDPELVIDRIGIVTPEGDAFIKGVIRLKGVTEQDLAAVSLALISKIEADIAIDASQKVLDKLPDGMESAGTAVERGYARREGDRLVSRIEFRHGELKINGKAQGIPGFGAPPPKQAAPE